MTFHYTELSYDGTLGLLAWSVARGTVGVTTIRLEKHKRLNLYFGPYQKESEEL